MLTFLATSFAYSVCDASEHRILVDAQRMDVQQDKKGV